MKAVHYEQPFQVSVREIPIPEIEHPDDVIIKVTTAGEFIERSTFVGERHQLTICEQRSVARTCICIKGGQRRRVVWSSVRWVSTTYYALRNHYANANAIIAASSCH